MKKLKEGYEYGELRKRVTPDKMTILRQVIETKTKKVKGYVVVQVLSSKRQVKKQLMEQNHLSPRQFRKERKRQKRLRNEIASDRGPDIQQ